MKKFELDTVEYRNLLAVGAETMIIDLKSFHKSLVTGTNGAGKSTIIEAITYALFGKPFRKLKLGQLINSTTKKDLYVKLTMRYNNDHYIIERGQKPALFLITKNGEELPIDAADKDFQSKFEDMIGMNYASYKQVVVLGTAGYTPFMGLSTPDRRKLVEDLLEVSVLSDMDKANKEIISKSINPELVRIEQLINHTNTQIKTLKEADERQKKLSGANLAQLQKMLDDDIAAVNDIKEKNLDLNEQILAVVVPDDKSTDIMTINMHVNQLNNTNSQLTRVIGLFDKGGTCPTCTQDLSDRSKISSIEESKNNNDHTLHRIGEDLAVLKQKQVEHTNARNAVAALESQIQGNRQAAIQHVEHAKKIKAALEQAKVVVDDNSEKILTLQNEYNTLVSTKSDLLVEKHRRGLIVDMLKDSGVKSILMKKYIPLFNQKINHYLELLDADYSFTLDAEFNESVKSRGRENFSYTSFSQGEKGRIDLALMFTWRDVAEIISGIQISCLILDEVFDSALDVNGSKDIAKILNTMPDTNVFIISHRDHDPEDYGQHIQMKKVGRFTVKV